MKVDILMEKRRVWPQAILVYSLCMVLTTPAVMWLRGGDETLSRPGLIITSLVMAIWLSIPTQYLLNQLDPDRITTPKIRALSGLAGGVVFSVAMYLFMRFVDPTGWSSETIGFSFVVGMMAGHSVLSPLVARNRK